MPSHEPDESSPPSPEPASSEAREATGSRIAERELLFVDQDRGISESTLVLPPREDEVESGVVESAVLALERLDPLIQEGGIERPLAGDRLLPGLIPLAPLTFLAFLASIASLGCSMAYATWHLENYLLPFAIANAVLLGHLWTYHLGYRTRKRFMVFRQVVLVTLLVCFLDWMLLDVLDEPPAGAEGHRGYLWAAIIGNALVGGLILLHWLFLGRGYRAVSVATGKLQSRHARPLPRHQEE